MSTPLPFFTQPLSKAHDRKGFACDNEALDRYLQRQARQDVQRKLAAVWVNTDVDQTTIRGFYSLSAYSLSLNELPESLSARLPRYPKLPAILLGRLAVDQQFQGRGIGGTLLVDALRRSYYQTRAIGALAVVVDAIDEAAVAFYQSFNFFPLAQTPHTFYLEMAAIEKLLVVK